MSTPGCHRPSVQPKGEVTVPWAGHRKASCDGSSTCAAAAGASVSASTTPSRTPRICGSLEDLHTPGRAVAPEKLIAAGQRARPQLRHPGGARQLREGEAAE